jgi:hypothetical protein
MFIGDATLMNILAYVHQFHITDECMAGLTWQPSHDHVAHMFIG